MDKSTYGQLSAGNPSSRHSNIYIHTILTELKRHPNPVSFKEIEDLTGISIERTAGLLDLLEKNQKVVRVDKTLQFIPTYTIKHESELLDLLKKTNSAHGISLDEILEASSTTLPLVESLVQKGQAILLRDIDGSATLFYNSLPLKPASPAVIKLYEEVSVPESRELARELSNAGLATKVIEKPIRKTMSQQRKKRYVRKIKITNTHLNNAELGM
ncbi:transcription initiation factor TFIIE subunit beta [Nematocida homosporus]|uniref:transcription initiation factor TFIIE subunit beta n=1 Tax=Nematocida homosporus TaxID=1912981 RepID=UPI00221F90FE|nr:transcription initiation factor TFIIE subunit beta [Nematocida homosporus]KAI5187153.1 transcription initiation factor TFIIE subunit beta [Nematocida homosporus]